MWCNYCQIPFTPIIDTNFEKIVIKFWNGGNQLLFNDKTNGEDFKLDINYCPMCGRKLQNYERRKIAE